MCIDCWAEHVGDAGPDYPDGYMTVVGMFQTEEEARAAYLEAKERYHSLSSRG